MNDRRAFCRLPHQQRCGSRDLVGHAHFRRLQAIPEQIRGPAQIVEAGDPRQADGHPDRTETPGPSVGVDDHDTHLDLRLAADSFAQSLRRAVRVLRQEQDPALGVSALTAYVGMVDPGIGTHKAQPVFDDNQTRTGPQDAAALAQDEFCQPWILAARLRKHNRRRRRRYVRQMDQPSFRFRDDLLGDHQHVTRRQPQAGAVEAVEDETGQVVTGTDHRQARQRRQSQLSRHA